jgi:prepilin-type N-terminal cleavage/methylation domain-containing protein/prepilin-type processing-associated H-X9-DG protein
MSTATPCPPNRTRSPRAAFTLVELLVVIGIIGLLLSILLPTLGKAREQARSVKCKSNMRTIYQACILFANENKQALPRGCKIDDVTGNGDGNLKEQTYAWLLQGIGLGPTSAGRVDFDRGCIYKFLGLKDTRQQILMCPSDDGSDPMRFNSQILPSAGIRTMSYSFNSEVNDKGYTDKQGYLWGLKLTRVIKSSEKIYIFEELAPNDAYGTSIWADTGDDVPSGRHGARRREVTGNLVTDRAGNGNYVFFDGHVEERAISQIKDYSGNNNYKLFRPITSDN